MSLEETESYVNSPLFKEAMKHFRVGKWAEGFDKLHEVEQRYPTEHDLRALHHEMEIRARISDYEIEEEKQRKLRLLTKYSFRFLTGLLILLVVVIAITTYSGWIQRQVAKAQTDFSNNMLQAELAIEFRNAQQLMAAGKSDDALAKYGYIQTKNPDYPGLADALSQAEMLKDIEIKYSQAMDLLQAGDSAQALSILQDIGQKMPNYRDVSLQIKNLQTQTEMTSVLQQADKAYYEARYEDALSGFESLRLMDPTFDAKHVEEYLFNSYILAAEALLAEPIPSMETLRKIDGYFSKALALRPQDRETLAARTQVRLVIEDGMIGDYLSQAEAALAEAPDSLEAQQSAMQFLGMALSVRPNDPNVLLQYQLAQAFIQAVSDFARSDWDSVIDQLEGVVEQQAGYASGTAIQTLYDAYIARGSDYLVSGEYALALEDFQRSAILAQQLTDSETLAFEAQIMIAEAQGSLNHYQEAILIYQDSLASIGLYDRIYALKNSLTDTLVYAEYLSDLGNYQNAFYAYRKLIDDRVSAYDQSTIVTVKSGDYVSMIARRYNTTVAAILSANKMNNQPRLTPNTQLIIPTLP